MKLNDLDEILDVSDIQQYLKIGRVQAYELIKANKFRTLKIGKRRIKIYKEDFAKWVREI